jgi:linoleoyl-CoA desaturase
MTAAAVHDHETTLDPAADVERLRLFGAAIDEIRKRVEAQVGEEDLRYFRRLDRFSKTMEIVGRTLIHFSIEPVSFFTGVGALWLHKQLQTEEIGHAVLHGVFDHLPEAKEYHSKSYHYETPVDEQSWLHSHHGHHHAHTNIVGKDDNLHFGFLRLTEDTPHRWYHRLQLPYTLFVLSPNFTFLTNVHVTGLNDLLFGNGRPEQFDLVKDRSWSTIKTSVKRAMRKYVPYYAKEYVFFPMLAGPLAPKVMFGNWLAEAMRDLWLAATIYSGHVVDVKVYPEGTRPKGRGERYAMQAEATCNFVASWPVSVLSGGLDCHIEHHLFPHLPPNRLREIRAEVQAVCEAHGVRYRREESWLGLLGKIGARISELSHDTAAAAA